MEDSPSAQQLLEAVALVLGEQVLPEVQGATAHSVRVAANLCRIVGRQVDAPSAGDIDAALARALAMEAAPSDPVELAAVLDRRLANDDPAFDAEVADLLFADVCRRVDIAKPGYRGIGQ